MNHHLNGEQTADEYIEELVDFIYNEIIVSRRFDKKEVKKLFNIVLKVEKNNIS
jgi:hypothetical protein